MPDLAREPSMEDILASIKRIIAEDGAAAAPPPAPRVRRGPVEVPPPADEVLELTETVAPPPPAPEAVAVEKRVEAAPPPAPPAAVEPVPAVAPSPPPTIVSERAATASRQSLAALSALVVTPEPGRSDNTLDGLVREMLRPMLKEWLDARLPELVEGLVAKEIARITGRGL